MSLLIWLPLTKDLQTYGVQHSEVTSTNAAYNANGKLGGCYSFNGSAYLMGTHDCINNNIDDWSFACWMKLNATTVGQTLFSCRTSASEKGITVFYYGSQWLIDDGVRWQFTPTITIEKDKWYHVCVVRKKGVGKYLYINGVLDKSTATTGTPTIVNPTLYAIGSSQNSSTTVSGNLLNGYLNDTRFYDHALSVAEIKDISKGLCLHYKLDTPFAIDNLNRHSTYAVYNNFASSGCTATLVNTGNTYMGCKIYRLTYTPDESHLNNIKKSLANHGIMGFRRTFLANTKYCFWILWKAISHPDTVCGGTASNISGWQEKASKKFDSEWNIVGQSRNGTVTTNKTDNIFTSFKTPSATAGTPIIIDFCCPHLVSGYDYILPEYDYVGTEPAITDSSGYGNNGTKYGTVSVETDSPRYEMSTVFDGSTSYINIVSDIFPPVLNGDFTISVWIYNNDAGDRSIFLGNWSLTGAFFGFEKTVAEKVRFYWNGSPDIVFNNSIVTAHVFSLVTVTRSGNTVKCYINGVLKDTSTTTLNGSVPATATNFRIASDGRTGATRFNGRMSDFRIYATALSAEDVLALYNIGARVFKNGMMAGYEMKEVY